MENRKFFISGHVDATYKEFMEIYAPAIKKAIESYDADFYIGDCDGVDILAQNYLVDILNVNPNRITVCHMLEKPTNLNPKIKNVVSNFKTHEERDSFMTSMTDEDIAFVRDGKEQSGTAKNLIRRKIFQTKDEKSSVLFGN